MQNYYEILGVSVDASQEEIKTAFISKMKMYHPDIYKGNRETAEYNTKIVLEAYNTLKNDSLRKSYNIKNKIKPEQCHKVKKSYEQINKPVKQVKVNQPSKQKNNISDNDKKAMFFYNGIITLLLITTFVMIFLFSVKIMS